MAAPTIASCPVGILVASGLARAHWLHTPRKAAPEYSSCRTAPPLYCTDDVTQIEARDGCVTAADTEIDLQLKLFQASRLVVNERNYSAIKK